MRFLIGNGPLPWMVTGWRQPYQNRLLEMKSKKIIYSDKKKMKIMQSGAHYWLLSASLSLALFLSIPLLFKHIRFILNFFSLFLSLSAFHRSLAIGHHLPTTSKAMQLVMYICSTRIIHRHNRWCTRIQYVTRCTSASNPCTRKLLSGTVGTSWSEYVHKMRKYKRGQLRLVWTSHEQQHNNLLGLPFC